MFDKKFLKRKIGSRNWYNISVASSSSHICLKTHIPEKRIEVGIYIDNDRELFEKFETHKKNIENELGTNLEWRAKENCQARSILAFKDGDIISEKEELSIKATKIYIGFYKNRTPLISIEVYKSSLSLWLNAKFSDISDPKNLVKDVSNIGHHGVGDCQIKISDDSDIGYIQDLIRKFLETKG